MDGREIEEAVDDQELKPRQPGVLNRAPVRFTPQRLERAQLICVVVSQMKPIERRMIPRIDQADLAVEINLAGKGRRLIAVSIARPGFDNGGELRGRLGGAHDFADQIRDRIDAAAAISERRDRLDLTGGGQPVYYSSYEAALERIPVVVIRYSRGRRKPGLFVNGLRQNVPCETAK